MENKKILITGAGSGLGKALSLWASSFATDLCLLSQSQQKLDVIQTKLNCKNKVYSLDFTKEKELDNVLTDLVKTNFIPDIIIHCAGGGFKMHDPLLNRQEFCRLLDVNLTSVIQINNQLIPEMINRQNGVVIHIGSTAAHAAHGSVAYNTAKAALVAYVRSLGRALAATGIVITGISPGSFIAEGNNMFNFKTKNVAEFENYAASLPAKRMIDVSEFLLIIKTLCEQKGPLFSGCMLPIDAGEGMAYMS